MQKWIAIVGLIALVLIFGLVYLNIFHPNLLSIFGDKKVTMEAATYLVYGRDISSINDGTDKVKIETDIVLTMHLEPSTRSVDILFIPPNTLIEGETELRDLYDEKGVAGLEEGVEKVMGQKADYFVGVDYQSFITLVNQLGGIEVDVTETLDFPRYGLSLKPGMAKLNGDETLKLLRLKYGDTTAIKRIERQKAVIQAIYRRLMDMRTLSEFQGMSDAMISLLEKLETNVEGDQIIDGFQFVRDGIDIFNVNTIPGELVGQHWIPAP